MGTELFQEGQRREKDTVMFRKSISPSTTVRYLSSRRNATSLASDFQEDRAKSRDSPRCAQKWIMRL